MENEFLLQLIQKLNTDSDFLDEFLKKETTDEMYEFASSTISGYAKEEFLQMLASLKVTNNSQKMELSDDSLDNVAGGSPFGVAIAGLTGFLSGGGGGLLKKLSQKLTQKEKNKKYEEYKKKHGLTDDDIVEMLAQEQAAANASAYKQNLIEEFKKSLL